MFIKTRTTVGEKREFKVYVQITRILYVRHTSSLKFFFINDCNLSYCVDFLAQKMQMSAFSCALYTGRVNKSVDASEKRKSYYTSHNFSYFPPNTRHHIEYRVNIIFNFVDTPRNFIIAKLSIRKPGSSSVLIKL